MTSPISATPTRMTPSSVERRSKDDSEIVVNTDRQGVDSVDQAGRDVAHFFGPQNHVRGADGRMGSPSSLGVRPLFTPGAIGMRVFDVVTRPVALLKDIADAGVHAVLAGADAVRGFTAGLGPQTHVGFREAYESHAAGAATLQTDLAGKADVVSVSAYAYGERRFESDGTTSSDLNFLARDTSFDVTIRVSSLADKAAIDTLVSNIVESVEGMAQRGELQGMGEPVVTLTLEEAGGAKAVSRFTVGAGRP